MVNKLRKSSLFSSLDHYQDPDVVDLKIPKIKCCNVKKRLLKIQKMTLSYFLTL